MKTRLEGGSCPAASKKLNRPAWTGGGAIRTGLVYSFLKSLSKALRGWAALRGAGGPEFVAEVGGGAEGPAVPSRATVTRGVNEMQSLALSFIGIRTGIGFRH